MINFIDFFVVKFKIYVEGVIYNQTGTKSYYGDENYENKSNVDE